MTITILGILGSLLAFWAGFVTCAFIGKILWFEPECEEDEDCGDDDEETGSPYRTPVYIKREDGSVEEMPLIASDEYEAVAIERDALRIAIKNAAEQARLHAQDGEIEMMDDYLEDVRKYHTRLGKLG